MYFIPDKRKEELRKPLGKIVKEIDLKSLEGKRIVTVGDFVTSYFLKLGLIPDISIVDYKIERKKYKGGKFQAQRIIKVKNPPGYITRELWNSIATAYTLKEKTLIEVDGEEDLAALPAIYLAPSNTTVIYGMPSKGMVIVDVGEKERKKVNEFLKSLEG